MMVMRGKIEAKNFIVTIDGLVWLIEDSVGEADRMYS